MIYVYAWGNAASSRRLAEWAPRSSVFSTRASASQRHVGPYVAMADDHPRDEWAYFTPAGASAPTCCLLVVDGREVEISEAKAAYVHDRIDVDELERRIASALTA